MVSHIGFGMCNPRAEPLVSTWRRLKAAPNALSFSGFWSYTRPGRALIPQAVRRIGHRYCP